MAIIRHWLAALLAAMPVAAQTLGVTLSGFVTDADNGESLPLASIVLTQVQLGAASNSSGYYAVKEVPAGTYEVVISYIGYKSWRDTLAFSDRDVRLDVALQVESVDLEEIVIEAERREELEQATQSSFIALQVEPLQQMPAIGEADLLRSLQLLPGIQSASDMSAAACTCAAVAPTKRPSSSTTFPLYNPSHMFGFFSTFNPDAIKDVQLYKGAYPAAYGRTLGAVLDVSNREGNRQRFSGRGGISLIASRLLAEGPVGQGSWMMAGRRTYLEPVLSAVRSFDIDIPLNYYFYDFNGKVNQRWGDDTFTVSTYWGQDDLHWEGPRRRDILRRFALGQPRRYGALDAGVFADPVWALHGGWIVVRKQPLVQLLRYAFRRYQQHPRLVAQRRRGLLCQPQSHPHPRLSGHPIRVRLFPVLQPRGRDLVPEVGVGLGLRPRRVAGRAAHAAAARRTGHLFQRRGSPALHASAVPQPRPQRQHPRQGRRGDVPPIPAIDHLRSLQRRRFLGAARQERRAQAARIRG